MTKRYLLPLLGLALTASQAWAGACSYNSKPMFCQWETGCYEVTTEYSGIESGANACAAGSCTCAALVTNCENFGTIYSGVTGLNEDNNYGKGLKCSNQGGKFEGGQDPSRTSLGCCLWADTETSCWTIWSSDEGATDKVSQCKSGTNKFWNGECPTGGSCPSGTPDYDGSANDCGNHWCSWGAGTCYKIAPDPAEGITTCADAITNCQNYGEYFTNSSCSGGSPVMKIQPVMGLIVATHGRALHISSDRDAKVTLYTLGGQKVLSGKVNAGNSVFSLMNQNPGVYYAVVQSGAYTQTVNVVLK
ncbi:MAG: T9SS type A sorting domain-containing protein [Fibromonadales bacterium]|nr:T9SS type A sorting domain-containing protein [Fibromonadales bacterium]